MRRAIWIALLPPVLPTALLALLLAAAPPLVPPALAAPQQGAGLALGPEAHSVRTRFGDGSEERYTSAGVGLAGDLQFVVDDRWSLSPFLQLSLERTRGDRDVVASHQAAGFQVRRWWDTAFVAVHAAYYVELLANAGSSSTRYGPGLGAAIGAEPPGRPTWALQLDLPLLLASHTSQVGLRLQVGWRWR